MLLNFQLETFNNIYTLHTKPYILSKLNLSIIHLWINLKAMRDGIVINKLIHR
jgi:hypothetical protein